ncbi:MAG: DNA/RNA non-specific endonuclease, partial [Burkholderiaceae bacterium]|nr:DNA/RNA non-specific endonuclease [Burkholderiaceae bacterium]
DRSSQRESFTLANMVPQDGENNRHLWAGIEGAVRKLALREGDLYVVTGPVFLGNNLQKIGNVLVPTHLYKLVYSPRQRAGAAFFVENRATADYEVLSVAQLESRIGINLLPSLTAAQKDTVLRLPKVKLRKSRGEK